MKIAGYICYALAALDLFCAYILAIDITGVWWSPMALSVIGTFLIQKDGGE